MLIVRKSVNIEMMWIELKALVEMCVRHHRHTLKEVDIVCSFHVLGYKCVRHDDGLDLRPQLHRHKEKKYVCSFSQTSGSPLRALEGMGLYATIYRQKETFLFKLLLVIILM